ncbi:MAG: hypothetical protein J7551_06040 [Chloroflexi bacterium]|nr:hypothetical protein [Chloroflexota bacterium]
MHALVVAHPDVTYAKEFVKALQRQLPEYTFTLGAAALVPFGSAVQAGLRQALTGIDLVLVLFSGKPLNGAWLSQPNEPDRVALALALEQGKPVQPVLFSDGRLPDPSELPSELEALLERHPSCVSSQAQFMDFVQVLRTLKDRLVRAAPTVAAPDQDAAAPRSAPPARIHQFLADAGIAVRSIGEPEAHDEVLDRLAMYMGTRYPFIRQVYQHIKRSLSSGKTFTLNLAGKDDNCISHSTQLCTELRKLALLEYYEYRGAPQYRLMARPSRTPLAHSFFSGGWLERFTRQHLSELFRTANVPFEVAHNVQVTLPQGRNFEFDLLFSVGESGRILWFETKTANYQDRINKYAMLAHSVSLNARQIYLVLLDTPEDICTQLQCVYKINVLNLEGLQALTLSQLLE